MSEITSLVVNIALGEAIVVLALHSYIGGLLIRYLHKRLEDDRD